MINLKTDSWEKPSENLELKELTLKEDDRQVLHIPVGYFNGFMAIEKNSKLMVFSDFSIGDTGEGDFRFEKGLWFNWEV
jgi:dTDP-4-dehydrorhamnose 3,5-epimerase-like enzyme